jgi:hypothetical protein
MIDSAKPAAESYSPRRRTALVLTGTGTAGAYHAGVLRALHEAGVKLDIVAGRGIGVIGALFAAIDGAQRLWDDKGFWRAAAVRSFYPWTRVLRLGGWAIAVSVLVVAVPLTAIALGLIVFPIDFVLKMAGVGAGGGLAAAYLRVAEAMLAPEVLPTWLPRIVVLVLSAAGAIALVSGFTSERKRRRRRGPFWWRAARPPLSASEAGDQCWQTLWDLIRGAARLKQPPAAELCRRYIEMLADNLGQPGFRELLITVHDLDAHRDLVFALVAEDRRRGLVARATTEAADARRAEVFDLGGVGRDHLADAIAGALAVPLATEAHLMQMSEEGYWRGETHRICDRPAMLPRILEELGALGVEQAVVVAAAPEIPGAHALSAPRLDARGRMGEFAQSFETATLRDATRHAAADVPRLFTIQPEHNAIGPFDFDGGFDDRSDRRQRLVELMGRGYEDAYRQFVEPVVGASGEHVGARPRAKK